MRYAANSTSPSRQASIYSVLRCRSESASYLDRNLARRCGDLTNLEGCIAILRDFESLAGRGARAVAVGGPTRLADLKAAIPPQRDERLSIWASEGKTLRFVLRDIAVIGAVAVEDEIRPESAGASRDCTSLASGWR